MSLLSTSANNNNFYPLLTTDKNLYSKTTHQVNTNTNLSIQSLNLRQIQNIYNKVDYEKLKGKKRYQNFPLFSIREKRLEKERKKKLTLRLRKNLSDKKIIVDNASTQNSVYITQNLSEVNLTNLPKLLEKLENINNKKLKKVINNKRNKYKKIYPNNEIAKTEKAQINSVLLNKLKISTEMKKNMRMNETENNLFEKKIQVLNAYRNTEYFYSTYIHKIHDFLNLKKIFDSKKEGSLQFLELRKNQIEYINEKIKSMRNSHKLLEQKFIHKYQEYLSSLYKEKDKMESKDIILCEKIYELRRDVRILEKKIKKLLIEKNIYRKWLIFQVQVKEKYLKTPKKYLEYLKIDNRKNLPKELITYVKNIIFRSPQDLINKIEYYENNNIKALETYHQITNSTYPLKDELNKQIEHFESISDMTEINEINSIALELKLKNEILKNRVKTLKIEFNILPSQSKKKKEYSKLYQKVKLMRINIVGKEMKKDNYENEEIEILEMLKDLEIEINRRKEKENYYKINCSESLRIAKETRDKEKRLEKMILNREMYNEKRAQLRQKLKEKVNKKIFIPKMKINWDLYKMKKFNKINININIKNDEKKENENDLLCY